MRLLQPLDFVGLAFGLLLAVLMVGADECDTPQPPPGEEPNFYCAPATQADEPGFFDAVSSSVASLYQTIVGGTPSTDFRSTVFVHSVGVGSCTGIVLSPRSVLTAAHCKGDATTFRVYLDPNDPAHYYEATGLLVHPEYTPSDKSADLMILYFDTDIAREGVGGIYQPKWTKLCEKLTAQGFGQTETDPEPCPGGVSKCLRESDYMVDEIIREGRQLVTKQRTPGGICFGDSGGPLYAEVAGQPQEFLVGVTSWTQSYDCSIRSGHVHAAHYASWLYGNWQGIGVSRPDAVVE